jgi:hypothetical protein
MKNIIFALIPFENYKNWQAFVLKFTACSGLVQDLEITSFVFLRHCNHRLPYNLIIIPDFGPL